jgi:(S)-ureidoglycine aminohydrolase
MTFTRMLSILVALQLISIMATAQPEPLKAGVFYNNLAKEKDGREIILSGSTTFFDSFEVMAIRLAKKAGPSSKDFSSDQEDLIIVREGILNVTINGQSQLIGPGSIAFIIPGDKVRFEKGSDKAVLYYRLRFKSKLPMDQTRAINGGGSFVIRWPDVISKETDRGNRRDFFNRPTASCSKYEMHVTTLNEGLSSHQPHTHPEEEVILLLSGEAAMHIDGKEFGASPGALVFLPSTIPHALKNVGKGPCQYFAFQWK